MITLQELRADQFELLYRNDRKTKWLLKVQVPNHIQALKIYFTRPANETPATLLHTLKCYKNLNDWFKKQER